VEHVETLQALLESDRWIERVRAQRDHLPEIAARTEVEATLRSLLAALQQAQEALTPVAAAYASATEEATKLRDRAAHLDKALASSSSGPRELEQMQHELESVRAKLSEAEDRELNLLLEVEPLEAAVADVKTQAQPLVARRAELTETIAELQATLDEEIAALVLQRNERASVVPATWLARYQAALARVGGSGAAHVDAGKCDGCRIALAPLDLDRFKHTTGGNLMDCPECGRLLLP